MINFTAKFDLLAARTDSDDSGVDVDIIPLVGTVTFTPMLADDKPVLAPGYTPRPAGLKLLPVTGYLDSDGQLKNKQGGAVGVRLLANDPILQIDDLIYRVSFNVRTLYGQAVTVDGGYFTAPATDSVINLTDVLEPTGAAIIQTLQQQAVYAHEIVDATTIGVNLMTASSAAAARNAIGAISSGVFGVNVDQFGAVGNGTSDDTTAIQNAINAASTAANDADTADRKYATVFFPTGKYLTGPLTVPSGVILEGDGATLQAKSGVSGYLLTYTSGVNGGAKRLRIAAANTTDNLGGIHVNPDRRTTVFEECVVEGFHGRAFYGEGLNPIIKQSYLYGLSGDQSGLSTYTGVVELAANASDAYIAEDCEINGGRWSGNPAYRVAPTEAEDMFVCALAIKGVSFGRYSNIVCENAETGVYVQGALSMHMHGVRSEFNWGHGYVFTSSSGRISDCLALENSKQGDSQYDGYHWTNDGGTESIMTCTNLHSFSNFGLFGSSVKHRWGFYDNTGNSVVYNTHFNPKSVGDAGAFSGTPADFGGGSGYTFAAANSAPNISGATPTVTGRTIFRVAGTTTITNFLGGVAGQIIYIVGNSYVSVAHNATINTLTGSATLLQTGQWYAFMRHDGVWRQLDLSGNYLTDKIMVNPKARVGATDYPIGVKVAAPATPGSAGQPGYWANDNSWLYFYTGNGSNHSWLRIAGATW